MRIVAFIELAIMARVFFGESLDRRVWTAVALMVVGGGLLVWTDVQLAQTRLHAAEGLGLLAVLLATLAWAFDNTLTRPLSDLDPT